MTSHVELQLRGYLYLYQSAVPVLLCMNTDVLFEGNWGQALCAWWDFCCVLWLRCPRGEKAFMGYEYTFISGSSFVWRGVRIIQGPSIGAFQLALKWKLAMFMNNPSANWWSAKMINRPGIDCLLHKTISLALLSTGFSPEQTLNIYQRATAGILVWVVLLRCYSEHTH